MAAITSPSPSKDDLVERYYQQAIRRAASARSIAASAVSPDDWRLAQQQWQDAIQALKAIPVTHPRYSSAIALIAVYQQELSQIPSQPSSQPRLVERTSTTSVPLSEIVDASTNEEKVIRPGKASGTTLTFTNSGLPNSPQWDVKVKRWFENRPLVTVTINQAFQFEMVVDPKANTTQITSTAAQLIGLTITQQVVVDPRSSKFSGQGRIDSLQIGDITVNNPLVTVGDENLQLGILGRDILGNFQIAIDEKNIKLSF